MSQPPVDCTNAFYAPTLLPAIEELLSRGVAPSTLEACFRRTLLELRTPLMRIPLFVSRRFWDLAEQISDDSTIGLVAGKRFVSTLTNGLTYLFDVAPNLESACAYFSKYFTYFNGSLHAEIRLESDSVALVLLERGALLSGKQSREYTVVSICSLLRRKMLASGISQDPLKAIELPGIEPYDREPYVQALRTSICWRPESTEVVLRLQPELFRQPLSPPNAHLEATLVEMVEHTRSQTESTLLEEASDHIARTMAQGANFQSFCEAHHLIERTAYRRLSSLGWRYSELLDEQRRYRALDLLGDPARSLSEVTDKLGYGDLQSFSRAFSRWYQTSPGAWRIDLSLSNEKALATLVAKASSE